MPVCRKVTHFGHRARNRLEHQDPIGFDCRTGEFVHGAPTCTVHYNSVPLMPRGYYNIERMLKSNKGVVLCAARAWTRPLKRSSPAASMLSFDESMRKPQGIIDALGTVGRIIDNK
jgi:hypothetical protein